MAASNNLIKSANDLHSKSSNCDVTKDPNRTLRWLPVVGTFWTTFIFAAASKSFGVLYVSLRSEFRASDIDVSWVGAINLVVWGLTGPISACLCGKFGHRSVGVAGALVTSSSFALSALANSLPWLYITYGFCLGVGLSLVYTPGLLVVNLNFTHRKMLAVAIASSGLPFGTLIFPPLLSYITSTFSYQWCLVFLSILSLFLLANGILYRLPGEPIMGETSFCFITYCEQGVDQDPLPTTYLQNDMDLSTSRHSTSHEDLKISCRDYNESQSLLGYIEESEMSFVERAKKYLCMLTDVAVVAYLFNSFNQQMINSFLSQNLVAYGLEIGLPLFQGALLLSMEGLGSLLAPIGISLVMDFELVRVFRADIVNGCLLLGGLIFSLTPIVTSLGAQMTSAVLRGSLIGVMSVHGVTMAQIVIGLERTPHLFGLALAMDALASLVGRTIGGVFMLYVGSYNGVFILLGCFTLLGCFCFQLVLIFRRNKGYDFSGKINFGKGYFG